MDDSLDRIFVDYSIKKLRQLAARIGDCLGRLSHEQIWQRGSDSENAVGNLVLHLTGNVTQWILSGVGGEPDRRARDREFAARDEITSQDLAQRLHAVIDRATEILGGESAQRLGERVNIQGYDVTVMECIYHVVEHFAGHAGQIIFATKMMLHSDLGYYPHLRGKALHTEKTP